MGLSKGMTQLVLVALPSFLITLVIIFALRVYAVTLIQNANDREMVIETMMSRVLPLSVVLYPLWFVFKLCVNRSRSSQMRQEDDDFQELETRYKEGRVGIGHMSGKRGPFLEMLSAVRAAVMPTAKVGVLERKLPSPSSC